MVIEKLAEAEFSTGTYFHLKYIGHIIDDDGGDIYLILADETNGAALFENCTDTYGLGNTTIKLGDCFLLRTIRPIKMYSTENDTIVSYFTIDSKPCFELVKHIGNKKVNPTQLLLCSIGELIYNKKFRS